MIYESTPYHECCNGTSPISLKEHEDSVAHHPYYNAEYYDYFDQYFTQYNGKVYEFIVYRKPKVKIINEIYIINKGDGKLRGAASARLIKGKESEELMHLLFPEIIMTTLL